MFTIKNYAQWQNRTFELIALIGSVESYDQLILAISRLSGADAQKAIALTKAISDATPNIKKMKAQHFSAKRNPTKLNKKAVPAMTKSQQAALDAAANTALAGIDTNKLAAQLAADLSKPLNIKSKLDVKSGNIARYTTLIEDALQHSIIERARRSSGLLGQINVIDLPNASFRPAPVEVTKAETVKWKESTTLLDFTYQLNGTSALAQVVPSNSGFMANFLASDEAIADPNIDLVALVNSSIDKGIKEAQGVEIVVGDSEGDEFSGAFTDLIDVHGNYHEAFKPDAERFFGTFGAIKSGNSTFGVYDLDVAENAFNNILRLINSMPVNDRADSIFIMNPDDFTQLKQARTNDSQARLMITEDTISGYPVVLDDDVPQYHLAFGQPDLAIGIGVYSVIDKVNPYIADGGVKTSKKVRLKNWIKDNGKLRFMLPRADVALDVEAGRGLDLDFGELYQLQGSVNYDASLLTDITWTQTAGTAVPISDNKILQPTITIGSVADTITFELSCTDSDTNTVTDIVTFAVTDQLVVSMADASGTLVDGQVDVQVDGLVDSNKYDIIDRKLVQTSGDDVLIPPAVDGKALIRFFAAGDYEFSFTVKDEFNNVAVATNTVAIS